MVESLVILLFWLTVFLLSLQVFDGQELVVVEAMKMQNGLHVEKSGKVNRYYIRFSSY